MSAPPNDLLPDTSTQHESISLQHSARDQNNPEVNASKLLCPQCQAIFTSFIAHRSDDSDSDNSDNSDDSDDEVSDDEDKWQTHHENFDTYWDAVQQGCWICCRLQLYEELRQAPLSAEHKLNFSTFWRASKYSTEHLGLEMSGSNVSSGPLSLSPGKCETIPGFISNIRSWCD